MSKHKRFPTSPNNPTVRYFSWKGSQNDGYLSWWDKEEEKEVKVEFPFVFLPLKKLACITGFNSQQEENIYSNEVDNISTDVLNVKIGGTTIQQGLYGDIKDTIKAKGGKFTSSVYVAFKDENGDLQIGNIKFKGSSLGPWIDLQNSPANLSENAVVIKGAKLDDSGGIHFKYPVMDTKAVSDETNAEADKLYEKLLEYLDWKLERNEKKELQQSDPPAGEGEQPPMPTDDDFSEHESEMDDLPF